MPISRSQPTRLALVHLEARHAPATFTVTTAADSGNNAAPTPGSLRAAILQANATPGADDIAFAIPGAGVQTITPPAPLPAVTDKVTLNAATQPGFSGVPVVRLSGAAAGASDGLALVNHSGSTVRGLTIGGFGGAGVRIDGGGSHRLAGNLIGTTANGAAADGNGVGVVVAGGSAGNVLGGAGGDRNVISGNRSDGVLVTGGATGTVVVGNLIGTDAGGANAVPNAAAGVAVTGGATGTLVGGFNAGEGNVISGNAGSGIRVADPATAGTTITGNRIGLNFSGSALGNGGDGVLVHAAAGTAPGATGTAVRSNTITQNAGNGVAVRDVARGVRIEGNAIFNNGQLGIAIDPTANAGAAAPQITKIAFGPTGAPVATGTFTGRPNTAYQLNFFNNSAADPSGSGEGQTPLTGGVTVTTTAAGAGTFEFPIPGGTAGTFITATATALDTGETSAFSNAVVLPGATVNATLFAVGAGGGGGPQVNVYRPDGGLAYSVAAFDAKFAGGVRVAMADFTGDGIPDLVVGTGPGAATRVRVLEGNTRAELFGIAPFEAAFTGGVYVAAGDLTGDGTPDLVITPDEGGGPRVRVFDGKTNFGQVIDFFGIDDPNFRGGARAAIGDVNGDAVGDLLVAAGFLGGPRVAGYDGKSVAGGAPVRVFGDFFAFEQTLRNGVFLAAGDTDGDGFAEVIAGGGPGGGPRVTAFSGKALLANQYVPVANFFAGDPNNRGGVRLVARDLNADGRAELIAGPGPGGGSKVNLYAGTDLDGDPAVPPARVTVEPFPGFGGGVYVG